MYIRICKWIGEVGYCQGAEKERIERDICATDPFNAAELLVKFQALFLIIANY